MFSNLENNKTMILGAYKKLKSYYYYDKTLLYNKMRLSAWESVPKEMDKCINELAVFMRAPDSEEGKIYLSMLMNRVAISPMPKSFESLDCDEDVLCNSISVHRKLSSVNFFVVAPVELLILDMVWTLMIEKIAFEHNCIPNDIYANRLKEKQIFNSSSDLFEGIDFSSNRFLVPYFKQYSSWRDNVFKCIRKCYDGKIDTILVSLDIKSYFYSVTFDFNRLSEYLDNDPRLENIICLTRVVKDLHLTYTAEMQKYRGDIPADCKKGQSAFPIGLMSSIVLANLYLKDFDKAIRTKVSPLYYGRYVDDILLIVKKVDSLELSKVSILEKLLVKTDIAETIKESYKLLIPHGSLILQKSKIRCIYFNHTEPDAMIKLLYEVSHLNPSMSEGYLMPDINLSERSFDEAAYSVGQESGTLKIRNFLFKTNNFAASLFLNDLIRISKNVDVEESAHYQYIDKQLSQILKFYSSQQAIEYRSAWINIFSLILLNRRYDYFLQFYLQIYTEIEQIHSDKLDAIEVSKIELVLTELKKNLHQQLDISASIAIAPYSIGSVRQEIQEEISKNGIKYQTFSTRADIIYSNAKDIRISNMFNHHLVAFPLLNYVSNSDNNASLINLNPQEISQYWKSLQLDSTKIEYSPRFIHLDELYLWYFETTFSHGGNPLSDQIIKVKEQFIDINKIKYNINSIEETKVAINDSDFLQYIGLNNDKKEQMPKAAIASIYIDEYKDVIPVLKAPRYNLSPIKKHELYRMLNDAKEKQAKIIVFPEFFLPIQWLEDIMIFSRKNQIIVLSGLRYMVDQKRAYNYLTILQPFSSLKFNYLLPLFREKNYYAPAEKAELAKNDFTCKDPDCKSTQLISWNGIKYSNLMCYELTNIEFRYTLRGRINLLIVPELNKDTNYFSNIVESTTRDLHCFVIQVNTAKYGDSRITGPYKSLFKDILQIKGGDDTALLTGNIDIKGLEAKRNSYQGTLKKQIKDIVEGKECQPDSSAKEFKAPSAGYKEVY